MLPQQPQRAALRFRLPVSFRVSWVPSLAALRHWLLSMANLWAPRHFSISSARQAPILRSRSASRQKRHNVRLARLLRVATRFNRGLPMPPATLLDWAFRFRSIALTRSFRTPALGITPL